MKPFDNRTHYDAGRFRTSVTFFRQVDTPSGYGGTDNTFTEIKTVKAVDLQIRQNDQLAISAGASVINEDRYFIIRKEFKPEYDMTVKADGKHYILSAIIPVDVPLRYYRILCVRKDDQETWQG